MSKKILVIGLVLLYLSWGALRLYADNRQKTTAADMLDYFEKDPISPSSSAALASASEAAPESSSPGSPEPMRNDSSEVSPPSDSEQPSVAEQNPSSEPSPVSEENLPSEPPPENNIPVETPPVFNSDSSTSPYISISPSSTESYSRENHSAVKTDLSELKTHPIVIDSMELKNTDIIDVLKLIVEKTGLNIVTGQDVSGKVSIFLKNIDVLDALKIILDGHNLAYSIEDGVIRIMSEKDFQLKYGYKFGERIDTKIVPLVYGDSSDIAVVLNQMKSIVGKIIAERNSNTLIIMDTPDKIELLVNFVKSIDVPRTTEVFELSYAQAEDVSKKTGSILTKNLGTVEIDARSNKLIVTDSPEKIKQVREFVKAVDVKEEEVLIEAKIVQVILSDQNKMGVDWEAIVKDYHNLDLKSSFNILEESSKQGKISIGTLSDDDYTAMIQALNTIGNTNVLSNPRITVVDNKEAKILVGSTEPYITSTTITNSSGPTTISEAVNFIEVGVKLHVTPHIHKDDFVTMLIKPEVSSVLRSITTSNNNTIPVVETSEAETTVMVKDGVTIVIGGLMKDEKIKTVNKVPILGDIPLLGVLFRNKDDLKRKTELVIFLTPHIITGGHNMSQDYLGSDQQP